MQVCSSEYGRLALALTPVTVAANNHAGVRSQMGGWNSRKHCFDRQLPVIQKQRECTPVLETVIKCFGCSRAVHDLLPLQQHPRFK